METTAQTLDERDDDANKDTPAWGAQEARVTVEQADTFLRRLTRLRQQQEAIKEWTRKQEAVLERKAQYYLGLLAQFAVAMREDTGSSSIALPSGAVSVRRRPPKVRRDDEALLAVLAGRIKGDMYWHKTPSWTAIMGLLQVQDDGTYAVKADGELLEAKVVCRTDPEGSLYSVQICDSHGNRL